MTTARFTSTYTFTSTATATRDLTAERKALMLGTFQVFDIGSFVVSGDNPEDFLWDLFDLIVSNGSVSMAMGGATIIIPDQEGPGDAGERRAFRHTAEWEAKHSEYFLSQLLEGSAIAPSGIRFAPETFFSLHAARLVGKVNDSLFDDRHSQRINRVALYKYGSGTPEYMAALNSKTYHDYPYQDLAPEHVINYLLLKGAITLTRRDGGEGLITEEELQAWQAERQREKQALIDEEQALIAESSKRRRSRRPKAPTAHD